MSYLAIALAISLLPHLLKYTMAMWEEGLEAASKLLRVRVHV